MKTEENNIPHMTKFNDVKKKIDNLAKEENCPKLKKGVRELHTFIHTYPFHKIIQPKKVIFHEIIGYKDGTEILGKRLGYISRIDYEQNKEIIEKLRKEGNIEELKNFLNEKKR
ncbi:MAG: hypothetical protein ACFFDN_00310 [Candidatus Hodarchaeota archaeon]